MHRVAVIKRVGPEPLAIVVDRHRSIDHLVAAVAIDIGDAELVIAAIAIVAIAGRRRIEQPAPGQLAVAEIPSGDRGAGIIAAADNHAGMPPVEISGAGQEAVGAVGVTVPPRVA